MESNATTARSVPTWESQNTAWLRTSGSGSERADSRRMSSAPAACCCASRKMALRRRHTERASLRARTFSRIGRAREASICCRALSAATFMSSSEPEQALEEEELLDEERLDEELLDDGTGGTGGTGGTSPATRAASDTSAAASLSPLRASSP